MQEYFTNLLIDQTTFLLTIVFVVIGILLIIGIRGFIIEYKTDSYIAQKSEEFVKREINTQLLSFNLREKVDEILKELPNKDNKL